MIRGGVKSQAIAGWFIVTLLLAACGDDTGVPESTTSTSTTIESTTSLATTSTTEGGATVTTIAPTTTTTVEPGPFGSGVSPAAVGSQLGYSLASGADVCLDLDQSEPRIIFEGGATVNIGNSLVICFPGFGDFWGFDDDETVTITLPGEPGVEVPVDFRGGSDFVYWTVLPGDPLGEYTVSAVPTGADQAVEERFTVAPANTPGLRVVAPDEPRWLQREWPGEADELGRINLAYFGLQGAVLVDIYGDPDGFAEEAEYVGTLQIVSGTGGTGILVLPTEGEEGFFCFSFQVSDQECDAAVRLSP